MQQSRQFHVQGLDCAEEITALRRALDGRPGVETLEFDLLQARLSITYDDAQATPEDLLRWIGTTGMRATPWQSRPDARGETWWHRHGRLVMTAASGAGIALAAGLHALATGSLHSALAGKDSPPASIAIYTIATIAGAWFVFPRAVASLRQRRLDMHVLMCVAAAGAMALGDWLEGAMVAFLFGVALLLEQASLRRTQRAIAGLLDLAPAVAHRRLPSGSIEDVPAAEIAIGTRIIVSPGEKFPLDGTVISGTSHVNEAPITGESRPVSREPGDAVYAGSINGSAALELETTRQATDTTLARIVHLVYRAQAQRSARQAWIERFAERYTPGMLLLAVAIALVPLLVSSAAWSEWIYRSLVVLVIACPCALVISTPVSLVSALTAAARRGVLVKGGLALETAAAVRAFAFDKTGTLTTGETRVVELVPLNGHTPDELLARAATLEQHSRHPLARAVVRSAEERGLRPMPVENLRELDGRGIVGTLEGREFWIGSRRLMLERAAETAAIDLRAHQLEGQGQSVVALGNDRHVCGLLSVADVVRPEAARALADLKAAGIRQTAILTGDNAPTAETVRRQTGADLCHAALLPEDKLHAIARLVEEWGTVAMVGDGVNDAPALARATLGIAMGAAGSDTAIETADVALMSDDLLRLPWLVRHARRTLSILRANIAFSLAIKVLFLILALTGWSSLWLAIAADTGATLAVIANSLRLLNPGRE